ncbi:hypothetical protein GCM10012287_15680 [Streptomyces daqingensis]|jgi:uncharacterized protein (UPF0548 family)|uniref:DUF1990 domain-containing protein n=1 Tax=Streptomyces daqingensis TaxID=1472640 RepID=A0ABQ2M2L2_9ACTN|nr:DUF1990 family protein [Streptomyces daqingensis]GGO46120.1 hypothetical protein GCM10012287_15680 [Streptomyces daqingensis]
MPRERRLYREEAVRALRALASLDVNYPGPAPRPGAEGGWHIDTLVQPLPPESAGDPVPGGSWETARRLVRDYQFAEPRILRSVYDSTTPLLGRDMLLEGRFYGLRFDMGVRVTSVTDEVHGSGEHARRVWGWSYQTLQGHLEQGELTYEVVKHLHTGAVDFVITGYSRRAPIRRPLIRIGFMLFGRLTQRRFYRRSANRLHRLLQGELRGIPAAALRTHPADARVVVAPARAPLPKPVQGVPHRRN